jgi:hypothetical protein
MLCERMVSALPRTNHANVVAPKMKMMAKMRLAVMDGWVLR